MKAKTRLLPLLLLPLLLLCACSRSVLLAAPKELRAAAAVKAETCAERKEPADTERLVRILEGAEEMQPGSAGSSLRLGALAGELLRWLEDHPDGAEAAGERFRNWAAQQDGRKLSRIRKTLRLLKACAQRMHADQLRALLEDAGFSLSETGPSREEFLELLERLTEAIRPKIFRNTREIMNNFR